MISLHQISKSFNAGKVTEVNALNHVSTQIQKGEFVVMVGANGSGKTTLLNIISGSDMPTLGTVEINGQDVTPLPEYQRSRWIARVFQNPTQGTAPDMTILENFRLASLRTKQKNLTIGINGSFRKKVSEKIAGLGMGLENKLDLPMGNLSGGQRQALTLMMGVMDETDILLLDEPTAALDPRSALMVMNLASQLQRDLGLTTLLITHNLKDALLYGNRLIQMQEGKIVRNLNSAEKTALTMQDIYQWFE